MNRIEVLTPSIVAGILDATETLTGVPADAMRSSLRQRRVLRARNAAAYVIRERYDIPLEDLALMFNRFDHTTMINALRRADMELVAKIREATA